MKYDVSSVDEYLKTIDQDRVSYINKLREVIKTNLDKGFEETISYGMIAYVVPLSIYPKGYHAKTNTPLPYLSIASQKNSINIYHTGIYQDKFIYDNFSHTYIKLFNRKPDMGKSCIRLKNLEEIPYQLIGELAKSMTVEEVIASYENRGKNDES